MSGLLPQVNVDEAWIPVINLPSAFLTDVLFSLVLLVFPSGRIHFENNWVMFAKQKWSLSSSTMSKFKITSQNIQLLISYLN